MTTLTIDTFDREVDAAEEIFLQEAVEEALRKLEIEAKVSIF